ncbi:MAG: DUF1653 domain-containing protein [Bacilli bacterium]|nr:DUF1653 domain-containing protein [Bacilli bacterium]
MERKIKTNTVYRHFKGDMYLVLEIAEHTETGEAMVIYRALYGSYKVYARPYAMFASEVDYKKYPNVKQKYRFQEMKIKSLNV